MSWKISLLGLLLVSLTSVAPAQDVSNANEAALVEDAADADIASEIQSLVKSYVEAFNAADANKLGTFWSANGLFVDASTGEKVSGRQAIVSSFEETFSAYPGLKLACVTDSVNASSPNVVVETGEAVVTRTDGTIARSSYQVVYVRQDGNWLIDCVTDNYSPLPTESTRLAATGYLGELEWLVGQWVDRDGESTVELSCDWTRGNRFLVRKYSVISGDECVTSGLQLIGWDANNKSIRSWLFDENGTVVQGTWNRNEGGWRIHSVATFGDGTSGSSTTILTPLGDNSYRVEKIDRIIDGQILPHMEAVTVVRR